jgi:hypothetical protein
MSIEPHVQRTIDRITLHLESGGDMAALMREDEQRRGHLTVIPGDVPWLRTEDWPADVVISLAGKRVRIVAIYAKNPGQGAFRQLIADIQAAGLTPCVLGPLTLVMQAIMRKWKWKRRDVGQDFETFEERWEPRKWRKRCTITRYYGANATRAFR